MSLFSHLKNHIEQDQAVTLAVVVRGPDSLVGVKAIVPEAGEATGPLLETDWAEQILTDARKLMQSRRSARQRYEAEGEAIQVFFDVHRPAPRLIIVGGVHIAIDLIRFARPLGFKTYLVDPRTAFATPDRFPHVDEIVPRWPDEALAAIGLTSETSVVVVTHDPKLDDPALLVALPSPAHYVGALGSQKTHAQRVERLQAAGLSQEQLDRLHAPIGLNLGGRSPAEIALSIMAEIVAVRNGGAKRVEGLKVEG
jgi:xanthine dehydrogenase accessory factor